MLMKHSRQNACQWGVNVHARDSLQGKANEEEEGWQPRSRRRESIKERSGTVPAQGQYSFFPLMIIIPTLTHQKIWLCGWNAAASVTQKQSHLAVEDSFWHNYKKISGIAALVYLFRTKKRTVSRGSVLTEQLARLFLKLCRGGWVQ